MSGLVAELVIRHRQPSEGGRRPRAPPGGGDLLDAQETSALLRAKGRCGFVEGAVSAAFPWAREARQMIATPPRTILMPSRGRRDESDETGDSSEGGSREEPQRTNNKAEF